MKIPDHIIHKKILVIDDAASMRSVTIAILSAVGFDNIDEADDGTSGLKKLQAGHYDFVICDWTMPNMDGLELLTAVRADEQLKSVPFLMCTSVTDTKNVSVAIKSGVTDYISKPFASDVLCQKIIKALDNT